MKDCALCFGELSSRYDGETPYKVSPCLLNDRFADTWDCINSGCLTQALYYATCGGNWDKRRATMRAFR